MINIIPTIEDLYIRWYYNVQLHVLNYLCYIIADNQQKRSAPVVLAPPVQEVLAPPGQGVLQAALEVPRAWGPPTVTR